MAPSEEFSLPPLPSIDAGAERSTDLPRPLQTRGVTWVVKWVAAAATFLSSAGILVEFAYTLRAEQSLARAARSGAFEATLPQADFSTVEATVARRVAPLELSTRDILLRMEQNGVPIRGRFAPRPGDEFSVSVSVATESILPRWLRLVTWRRAESQVLARAEARIPGPALRYD